MIWISLKKLAFVVSNFVRGFLHGSADEVVVTFTYTEILRFKDKNHLKEEAYSEINKTLLKKIIVPKF